MTMTYLVHDEEERVRGFTFPKKTKKGCNEKEGGQRAKSLWDGVYGTDNNIRLQKECVGWGKPKRRSSTDTLMLGSMVEQEVPLCRALSLQPSLNWILGNRTRSCTAELTDYQVLLFDAKLCVHTTHIVGIRNFTCLYCTTIVP